MRRLKEKWGIKSNWHLALIFFVFSITGSLSVYVKTTLFQWIGVGADTSLLIMIPLYVVTIVPTYYMLLLLIGTLFGQYHFFLAFEKKSLGRLFIRRKTK
ncbi:MAG: hypothetical protein JW857_08720 [Bacteroidales bacterium]|nr:hypothetical protein [Bacteroidales bacterium]